MELAGLSAIWFHLHVFRIIVMTFNLDYFAESLIDLPRILGRQEITTFLGWTGNQLLKQIVEIAEIAKILSLFYFMYLKKFFGLIYLIKSILAIRKGCRFFRYFFCPYYGISSTIPFCPMINSDIMKKFISLTHLTKLIG
jgi:hypothetical protein